MVGARQAIGYARVSTADQNPDRQVDALLRAGVDGDHIHVDMASGAKASRLKLDLVTQLLREGDTLNVTRLDRHQRRLVSARARGRVGGRRPRLTEDQAALAQRLCDEREKTVQQIADMFGVPRSTVYGHLDKTKTVPRQPKKSTVTKPR
jgi:DNA invertase Pin-like site-specific DNA recombinase